MGNTKRRSIMFRRDITTNEAASELEVQVWKFLLLVKEHEITPTRLIGNNKMWDAVDVVMIGLKLRRATAAKNRLVAKEHAKAKVYMKAKRKERRESAKRRKTSVKEYMKQYYIENKEKILETSKNWYLKHKDTDEYKEYKKQYYAMNREERNEYAKRYYREHKAQG
jgi:hypothetical protein